MMKLCETCRSMRIHRTLRSLRLSRGCRVNTPSPSYHRAQKVYSPFNCFRVVLPCVVVTSPSLVLLVRYGRSTALLAFNTGPAKCLRRPYVLDNMGPSAAPQNTEPRRKRMKHTRYFSRRGASELIYTPGQHYSHLNATH